MSQSPAGGPGGGADCTPPQLDSVVVRQADPRAVDLLALGVRLERRGLGHLDATPEVPRRDLDVEVHVGVLGLVERDVGSDLLEVARAEEKGPGHDDARLGAVLAGTPGPVVGDDLTVLVDVHLLAEVVDVVGLAAAREEVAGDLGGLTVDQLALLDHAGADAHRTAVLGRELEGLGVLEHRDRQVDGLAVLVAREHGLVARVQAPEAVVAAAVREAALLDEEVGR